MMMARVPVRGSVTASAPAGERDLPPEDVAGAGGWKGVTTLLACYQATMLRVMGSPAKVVSRRAAGAAKRQ